MNSVDATTASPTVNIDVVGRRRPPFDQIIDRWFPLTYVLNNLNRGMGLRDAYPFVLPTPVIEKLRFIHDIIGHASATAAERPEVTVAS